MSDRFYISDLTVGDLFNILRNPNYDLILCCVRRDRVVYRYKISNIVSLNDLYSMFEKNSLRIFESGLNSDDINIFEGDFIECYKKLP